jgi:hypothetical protein
VAQRAWRVAQAFWPGALHLNLSTGCIISTKLIGAPHLHFLPGRIIFRLASLAAFTVEGFKVIDDLKVLNDLKALTKKPPSPA